MKRFLAYLIVILLALGMVAMFFPGLVTGGY